MKQISYQDLKKSLSAVLDEVAAGAEIEITRHNKPTALLRPPQASAVRIGKRFGRAALKPLFNRPTGGLYLEALRHDRLDEGATAPGEGSGQEDLFIAPRARGKRRGDDGGGPHGDS